MNPPSVLCVYMVLVSFLQWSLPALAGSIVSVQPLNFGNIVVTPSKDTIEIDASYGAAVPRVYRKGHSLVTEGHSGKICVQCGGKGEIITLLFPARITDSDGGTTPYVDGFSSRSTPTPIVCKGTETIDLHIGGLLHLRTSQPAKDYTFDGSITVNFDDPEHKKKAKTKTKHEQKND